MLDETLVQALSEAEDRVSRLDERVRACAFRAGWSARRDFSEALAWGWNSGRATGAEDLLLHDESMDVRLPTQALRAVHGVVRARRKTQGGGEELLSATGMAWILGRRPRPPSAAPEHRAQAQGLESGAPVGPQLLGLLDVFRRGVTEDVDHAVEEWLGVLRIDEPRLPLLLQAAVALEAWTIIDPYPRETYAGPLMVAHWLRLRGRVRSHLLGLEVGLRQIRRGSSRWEGAPLDQRLHTWLMVISESAAQGGEELNRLELARQVALARIGPRRAHSHMNALIDLFLERPLITAPLAAQRLRVSAQTARRLIAELAGCLAEVSGQQRYRAWRL